MGLKTLKAIALGVCIVGLVSGPAIAKDKADLRKPIECMPAKDIVKLLSKFHNMAPEKRDTVDAVIAAKFDVDDGQALPDRIFSRSGGVDTSLILNPDGSVPDFGRLGKMPRESELCVEDQARAGMSRKDDGLSFDVDFDVKFKDESGRYSLAALRDGAKDGKSFYKKMVPAPIRLMIPKMTHISLTFDNPDAQDQTAQVFAGDQPVEGLVIEPFGKTLVIELDHIEALGADTLVISGGGYDLEPSPSIEKMKKLGFAEEDDETSDADK